MDDQRNPQSNSQQDAGASEPPEAEATPSRPNTMFDRDADREAAEFDEMRRFARRRAAIWGLAAGGIMSLILILCAVLLYLVGTR